MTENRTELLKVGRMLAPVARALLERLAQDGEPPAEIAPGPLDGLRLHGLVRLFKRNEEGPDEWTTTERGDLLLALFEEDHLDPPTLPAHDERDHAAEIAGARLACDHLRKNLNGVNAALVKERRLVREMQKVDRDPKGVEAYAQLKDLQDDVAAYAKEVRELHRDLGMRDKELRILRGVEPVPVPMLLTCPMCSTRHVDRGRFATKPHHTHACQSPTCGHVWRPAVVATVGVQHLPGFLDSELDPRVRAREAIQELNTEADRRYRIRAGERRTRDPIVLGDDEDEPTDAA